MPFEKGDERINRGGRPVGSKVKYDSHLKNGDPLTHDDMVKVYNKLKPLTNKALKKLGLMMDEGTEAARLKAIMFAIKEFQNISDVIAKDIAQPSPEDEEEEEESADEASAKLFSFKVVDKG